MPDLFRAFGPIIRSLDPELAHKITVKGLSFGFGNAYGVVKERHDAELSTEVFGLKFPNPVGLAAGFDKNAEVPDAMLQLGFGFVEVGTITPRPQIGNPKPRIFRLSSDAAVINRMGFNNHGLVVAMRYLMRRRGHGGIVGANLGANKDSEDRVQDYVAGLHTLLGHANYFTINISSPNTPGLRGLQNKKELQDLINRLLEVRDEVENTGAQTPMLLKIAPDLSDDELGDIIEVLLGSKIDGLIVSNTTIAERDTLLGDQRNEKGGLSGAPLLKLSTERLSKAYELSEGRIPLVGVGGISSGADAYEKIKAGASLVQLYTALIFKGPALVRQINEDLKICLRQDGFKNIAEAIGSAHR